MSINKINELIFKSINSANFHKYLLFAIIITLFIQVTCSQNSTPIDVVDIENPEIVELDTFIPSGFTLLPIALKNHNAISSVLGSFGIVDLYKDTNGRQVLIAENIKIFRAPKNNEMFHILVRANKAKGFLEQTNLSFAVIKPRNNAQSKLNENTITKRRSITIGVDK